MPRRARHLIPAWLPRRGEAVAACAVLIVGSHLLLAQLTGLLAVVFAVTGRVSRWRLWWLAAPAAAGLAWALLAGPGAAAAGFAAGPARVLGYLAGGHLLAALSHPSRLFAGAGDWLPRQLPLALVAGAAEAALIGWLDWLRTDEWAVPPPRPGAVAALRAALGSRLIRAGAVLTRNGCALGVAPSTGARVALAWAEAAGGVLVTGASDQAVTIASLQFAHAALRRRKPLIVLDLTGGDRSLANAVTAACEATGVPLRDPGAAGLERVVAERSAAMLCPRSADEAGRACSGIAALGAELRRMGVDGDGLVWVHGADRLRADTIAALPPAGQAAGLPVLLSTSSPAAAAELAGFVSAVLALRLAAPGCAAALAELTGARLRPPGLAGQGAPVTAAPPGTGLVAVPAVPARALLSLGAGEFVLSVQAPRRRLVELGRLVPARLPPAAAPHHGYQVTAWLPAVPAAAALTAGGGSKGGGTEGGWRGAAAGPQAGWRRSAP